MAASQRAPQSTVQAAQLLLARLKALAEPSVEGQETTPGEAESSASDNQPKAAADRRGLRYESDLTDGEWALVGLADPSRQAR